MTPQIWGKTQNLVKAVEICRRESNIRIPLESTEKIFHAFFITKPTGEKIDLELSLTGYIIAGWHSGTSKVESGTQAYTKFIITLPKL
ncbi:MAG: hypothetical protein KY448_06460 [Cyanobacteria bacterium 0813]|nr:hypothetical protein [Cyanobacteria bacterium 0813]